MSSLRVTIIQLISSSRATQRPSCGTTTARHCIRRIWHSYQAPAQPAYFRCLEAPTRIPRFYQQQETKGRAAGWFAANGTRFRRQTLATGTLSERRRECSLTTKPIPASPVLHFSISLSRAACFRRAAFSRQGIFMVQFVRTNDMWCSRSLGHCRAVKVLAELYGKDGLVDNAFLER